MNILYQITDIFDWIYLVRPNIFLHGNTVLYIVRCWLAQSELLCMKTTLKSSFGPV